MRTFMLGAFLVLLACMMAPTSAFAQAAPGAAADGETYSLPENDVARKTFFEPLFGPLVDESMESPLTGVVLVFNTALLFVAGLLVAYTIVSGILSTAHDGEMMGKKWSAVWVPVRTVLGAGAILPIVGGGWSVIQVIVIWLAMQGAGIANAVWAKFLENGESLMISATYTPSQNLPVIRDAYIDMLIASACVAGRNAEVGDPIFPGDPYFRIPSSADADPYVIRYGEESALTPGYLSVCGKISLMEGVKPDADGRYAEYRFGTGLGSNPEYTDSKASILATEIFDIGKLGPRIAIKRRENFLNASVKLEELGKKIASSTSGSKDIQAEVNKTLDELLKAYSDDIAKEAKDAYADTVNTNYLQKISADGFVTAGAFYMKMAKTQDQLTRLITAPVSSSSGFDDDIIVLSRTQMDDAVAKAKTYTSQWRQSTTNAVQNDSDAGSGLGASIVSWFMSSDNDGIFGAGMANMDPNQNPIMMAKNVGDSMVTAAWSATTIAAVSGGVIATIANSAPGKLAGADGGFKFVSDLFIPIFLMLFSSLLVPGAILSTYVPMLPYILWLGVIFGWAVLLVEAVIAAPLWAIAHIAPDGDGVVGRGGQGYMLILSLVLRPPLMVIGFASAVVLMKPIGFLVNTTFLGAFVMGIDNPGWHSLTSGIAGLFIYMIVMIIIIQRVFSLIHVIPDKLLRWIGGSSGGELGAEAEALGQGGWAKTAGALTAGMAISQGTQSGIGNAMQGARQREETKATRTAGNKSAAMGERAQMLQDEGRAHASESKAMSAEGGEAKAAGLEAAGSNYASMENSAHAAAESGARIDQSAEAQNFLHGLNANRHDGNPGTEGDYLRQQADEAKKAVDAYKANPAENPKPRPFQEALAKASVAHGKQREVTQMASDINEGKIRDDKPTPKPTPKPAPGDPDE